MQSLFLSSLNDNNFIPFPDTSFESGIDKDENYYKDLHEFIEKFKSIEELKNNDSRTIWKYCGSDNEDLFKKNIKKCPLDWYYHTNEVNYTLNSFGYRTKNFNDVDWKNSIVIFGCSSVQGVGVDDSHTISSFLEQEMNLPVINMGIGGSSNEFHVHNVSVLLNKYPTPKAVILKQTSLARFPFYYWNGIHHRGLWNISERELKRNRSSIVIRNIISNNIIRNMCESKTTYINCCLDLEHYHSFEFLNQFIPNNDIYFLKNEFEGEDFARDLLHTGRIVNQCTAKRLAEILKSKLN
jgi:hypothetical protein